jgi:signal transduction histidine kinase
LTLIFEDNGIGIQEAVTTKIFNMFFRGTERSEGAGLGLYIVKQTLDKLGGNITVTARLGTGTTFTVSIPNYKSEKGN